MLVRRLRGVASAGRGGADLAAAHRGAGRLPVDGLAGPSTGFSIFFAFSI